MIKGNSQDNSSNPISQGQDPQGNQTATEVVQVQNEAKNLLGLAVLSASLLEEKLAILRLYNILEYWFEPTGTEADEVRDAIRSKFRSASHNVSIPGYGQGRRIVRATDKLPASPQFPEVNPLHQEEEDMSEREGKAVRITYLSADEIKSVDYTWYANVVPKQKESSELERVLFGQMLEQIQSFGPDINLSFLEEEFASVWNKPYDKLFQKQVQQVTGMQMPGMMGQQNGGQQPGMMPNPMGQNAAIKKPMMPSINTLNGGGK